MFYKKLQIFRHFTKLPFTKIVKILK